MEPSIQSFSDQSLSSLTCVLKVAIVEPQGKLHILKQLQSEVTAKSSASNTYDIHYISNSPETLFP